MSMLSNDENLTNSFAGTSKKENDIDSVSKDKDLSAWELKLSKLEKK